VCEEYGIGGGMAVNSNKIIRQISIQKISISKKIQISIRLSKMLIWHDFVLAML
jgi:hypothetical protein